MNRTEIEAKWNTMTPRERDAWVAEVVFEWESAWEPDIAYDCAYRISESVPNYTTDISAAWAVVKDIPNIDVGKRRNSYYQIAVGNSSGYVFVNRNSAPEAICLAALIAKLTDATEVS